MNPQIESPSALVSVALPAPSSCPPPLVWTEVLAQFQKQARIFELGTGSGRFRVTVFGDGQPLYFLNGWSGDADLFCLTAWMLREQFRCVLIDYPTTASNLESLATIVTQAADAVGDPSVDLFASNFGTAVGLRAALSAPDRIRRLVLQGPIVSYRLSWLEAICARLASWLPERIKQVPFRRRLLFTNHRLWFPPIDETRWQFLARNSMQTSLRVVARRFLMLAGFDFSPQVSGLRCPVLVITSEGDPRRANEAACWLAEQLPHARHENISNCGQVPFVTHPHRLANLLKPFLLPPVETAVK